ncbi:MAG: CHAT domain-containing protein [Bacteroidetes bacterium]|nr:CHAT domain-containing protein [Bacteroidota bacterium]
MTILIFMTTLGPFGYCQETGKLTAYEIIIKANTFFETRQYDSSMIFYKEFMKVYRPPKEVEEGYLDSIPEKRTITQVYFQIANICFIKGDYQSSESWYHKALKLSESEICLRAEICQNLGSLYFFKENYEYALLYYQKAWILYTKEPAKNSARITDLLINLGTVNTERGDLKKSLTCYHMADSVIRISSNVNSSKVAGLNVNFGETLLQLDAPLKALLRYRVANQIAAQEDGISALNMLIASGEGMAESYSRLGKTDSAMVCLEGCLALIRTNTSGARSETARIYLAVGDVLYRHKEWNKSIDNYNRALAKLLPAPVNLLSGGINLSDWEPELLDLYKIYEHRGRSRLQSAAHSGLDTTLLSLGCSDYLTALKICNHVGKDFGNGASRMTFHELTKSILTGTIESIFLLQKNTGKPDFDEIFSLADEARNRMLLEDLKENKLMKSSGVDDSIIENIRRVKEDIVFYSRKYISEDLSPGTPAYSDLNNLQNKVIDLKLNLDSLRKKPIEQGQVNPLLNQYGNGGLTSQVMKRLKNDEAMLEYLCSDSVMYLFLIRPDGTTIRRAVLPSSFYKTLRECLHQLKSAGCENFLSMSRYLYQCLIAPLESELKGIRHLIVIPDEVLSLFPFETLIRDLPSQNSLQNISSWHFLVKEFEISYHFSAEAWLMIRPNSESPSKPYSFAGFAPAFKNFPDKPSSFNALPFASKEVKIIASMFNQKSANPLIFLDTSATEKSFRCYASGKTHIHIATHSIISEKDPMNSGLIFSKSNGQVEGRDKNDGCLHLDEICNLQMDASLVVLSACSTGEGKVTRTEGVLALTRGFYVSGAANVVYSLWSIPDRLTQNFMLDFYRNFLSPKSYSTALREVKLKMISRPETSLPYMWAGIVLLGR